MKHNKKLPLRVWLGFAFIAFIILMLSILWLTQTVFLDQTYKLVKTSQVKGCAQTIATNIDKNDIESLITEMQEQNDMAITLYDVSSSIYTPIYANDPSSTGIRSFLKMSDIYRYYNQAKENGGSITITEGKDYRGKIKPGQPNSTVNQNNQNIIDNIPKPNLERGLTETIAYVQLKNVNNTKYMIIVESEITPVASVVQTLRYQLIIITVIMIIISILVAIFVGRAIAKPIYDTTKKAKELAKQNYEIEFNNSSYKEISDLNQTLSYTAKELRKVDGLRRELIANVSHDLRTPLTMITGYAEVMQDIPGENTKENLQIIIDESNRLSLLVSDLLDISKLQDGNVSIEKNVFSITDCIKDIFNRYTKLCEQDNLNLVFDYNENVYVEADELKITQVIYNLINNAINYIGTDNTVIVKQSIIKNEVRIDIIDHGEGISKENLPYIWDRYYKIDKEHKRAKIGTGLGLSIVKNILNAHHANYGVISKENNGSDFYFTLPISKNKKR